MFGRESVDAVLEVLQAGSVQDGRSQYAEAGVRVEHPKAAALGRSDVVDGAVACAVHDIRSEGGGENDLHGFVRFSIVGVGQRVHGDRLVLVTDVERHLP